MKYLIGSGFHGGDREAAFMIDYWHDCVLKVNPEKIVVITTHDSYLDFPKINEDRIIQIPLMGNLGHIGQIISGEKTSEMCGWSASVIALAMIAYNNESDFIYLEQDALAFGPWVDKIYRDCNGIDMVFGHKMNSSPWMPCSQSLFLIKHSFIPKFCQDYLSLGGEHKDNLPEAKFCRIEEMNHGRVGRLSFGVDRERPLPYDGNVWFAQKFSQLEIDNLKRNGLV